MEIDIERNVPQLVFVTGASRSGTTLAATVLGLHSSMHKLRETHYFGELWDLEATSFGPTAQREALTKIFTRLNDGIDAPVSDAAREQARLFQDKLPDQLPPAKFFELAVAEFLGPSGKSIACEQTPRNIFYARQLLELYPDARIIHMVRDPRAVLASQKHRWRKRGGSGVIGTSLLQRIRTWANYHPRTMTTMWNRAVDVALELEGNERFKLVQFEQLISDPKNAIEGLCDFLGVNFQEEMLAVQKINSSHQKPAEERGEGFSSDSIDRWKNKLSAAELKLVNRRCSRLMSRFGYEAEQPEAGQTGFNITDEFLLNAKYPLHLLIAGLVNPRRMLVQARAVFGRAGTST